MKDTDWLKILIPSVVLSANAFAKDYLSTPEAQKALFPDADAFAEKAQSLTDDQRAQVSDLAGVRQRSQLPSVFRAEKKKKLLGWFLVDEVVGKHEFITFAAALSPEGKVLGVEILTYRETHGGEVQTPGWRKNFQGKTLADPFRLGNDIPNISGATLSCRNVTDGVKRLLAYQKLFLPPT